MIKKKSSPVACKILHLPHGPIGSCSDLLQVPVPLGNFPCSSVDILPVKSRARAHSHETPPTTDHQAEGQDVAPCYHVNKLGFILLKDTSPVPPTTSVPAQIPVDEPAHHWSALRGLHFHPQLKHTHTHTLSHCWSGPPSPGAVDGPVYNLAQSATKHLPLPSSGHELTVLHNVDLKIAMLCSTVLWYHSNVTIMSYFLTFPQCFIHVCATPLFSRPVCNSFLQADFLITNIRASFYSHFARYFQVFKVTFLIACCKTK